MNLKTFLLAFTLFAFLIFLSGCGSEGESATAISGSVFAAPVDGASLTVTDSNGNTVAGPVVTTSGSFITSIPNQYLGSDLVFESSGGSFTDEATGETATAGAMAVYVSADTITTGSEVHATPATSIISYMVMQQTIAMTQAQEAFANAFGYTPDMSIAPTDATGPSAGAGDDEKLAGLRAAVFSQLALELGLSASQQFELYTALAQDLADGTLDGASAAGPIGVGGMTLPEDIQYRYVMALMNFRANGRDFSGLDNAQIGTLPFAKVVLTDSYRVEYVPGMMQPMDGKTSFTINVSDRNTGTGVPGLSPSVMPMMYMAEHSHSTPVGGVVDLGGGDYEVTIYYLMPSVMNDISMGYWDLKFMINAEEVHFSPPVMMAMGDTLQARLKGQDPDLIMSMTGGMEARTYFIFRDGLSGSAGSQTMSFFVAAKETMMSFPGIDIGTVLNAGESNELTVTDLKVQVSTDGINFDNADNNGSGSFTTAAPLNIADRVYVRLLVNGQQKTSDGMAPDGGLDPATTNEFVTFMVTP